jgi:hypothetical protein
MSHLRAYVLVALGGSVGAVSIACLASGCGDDTGGGNPMEAGADQTAEAGPDVTADTAHDTGHDTANPDEGIDAPPDVVSDAGVDHDAAEASVVMDAMSSCTSDAGEGGANAIEQFAAQYGQAYCSGQGKCCPGYDAGAFDLASCAFAWSVAGWESTLPVNRAVYTGCHLALDTTKAAACISALQNYACNPDGGPVTAAQYSPVTTACLGVLTGTIPTGSGGCLSSFECANGYCDLAADGGSGTGVCTALVPIGGPCTAQTNTLDEQCSQVGLYQPKAWCNMLDGGTTGTCAAPLADGVTCYQTSNNFWSNYGCTSLLCGDDSLCGSPATYPPPGFCANWPTDAGGGG